MNLLPQPVSVTALEGQWEKCHLSHASRDVCIRIFAAPESGLAPLAGVLAGFLEQDHLFRAVEGSAAQHDIALCLTADAEHTGFPGDWFQDECHTILIRQDAMRIEARSAAGIARGIQSIRQLLSGQRARLRLPCMIIRDEPSLRWRGLHLDVSRHFFPASEVMRFIDLAAFHKFNLFHWHLTDDQGWRLPVEGYPELTRVAAWRDATMVGHDCDRKTNPADGIPHGGFYTHDEIRAIVRYAHARGVAVLPEVDVPGHVQALVTAYPEFGNTGAAPGVRQCWGISDSTLNLEDGTLAFLDRVVDTLAGLFPFRYLHFGGDEARRGEWDSSPRMAARLRELGHPADTPVQPVFTTHLRRSAKRHGRLLIGWDELLEQEDPGEGTAMMFWRDSEKTDARLDFKALESGHPVVLANWSRTYLDLYQKAGEGADFEPLAICGHLPLEKVYAWDPLGRYPEALRCGILGAQGQLWTEYISDRSRLDYMAYPRACALAQVLWTGSSRESLPDFQKRLVPHLRRLDRLGVTYRPVSSEES